MGNIVRRITAWLRLWTMQDDLQEELQFHEEMKRLEFEGEGLPPRDAAVAARRAMGNLQLSREDARVVWTGAGLEAVIHDLRYGFRFLTRRPAFTATAAAILALGIGLATAMFSILDALILRPVPFTAPYALATVAMMNERGGRTTVAPSVSTRGGRAPRLPPRREHSRTQQSSRRTALSSCAESRMSRRTSSSFSAACGRFAAVCSWGRRVARE